MMRADPLGPPILWLVPRQTTFTAERQLTCLSGLAGFCRARVVGFPELGREIINECGGSAVPEITTLGRQMILGHLLRRHASQLHFYKSVKRQVGLAAELDRAFAELERAGQSADDLANLLAGMNPRPDEFEERSRQSKLQDLRLLYEEYGKYVGSERLDQHRRWQQILEKVKSCSFVAKSTFFVDEFYGFTDHERRMLGAVASAGARMEITLLMDPASPLIGDPLRPPDERGLFHRTECTYQRLHRLFAREAVKVEPPVLLTEPKRFTSPEIARLERELFGRSESADASFPPEKTADAILRLEAPDRRAEVDAAAREIRRLLMNGLRLREIAVIVRDLEKYGRLISSAFAEHDIPFFADRRRTAAHHPLLVFLRSALAIARDNWPRDAVFSLLKTGLVGASFAECDALENYVLLHRVQGDAWESPEPWNWRRDLLRNPEDQNADTSHDPEAIDRLRRHIAESLSPLIALLKPDEPIKVRQVCSAIYAVFDKFGVPERLAAWIATDKARSLEAGGEHEQVWAELAALFDEMVELVGDETLAPNQFVEVLESGLESFDLALAPPSVDQVLVGQADRTRCPPVRAVFVLGLNSGEFPAVARHESVLTDRDRSALALRNMELDRDGKRRLLDERLLGYCALTAASEWLIVSRATSEEAGRPSAPSIFWQRIAELFPDVPTQSIGSSGVDGVDAIATPGQLVAWLMQWVRALPAKRCDESPDSISAPDPSRRAREQEIEREGPRDRERDGLREREQEALALYHWLATCDPAPESITFLRSRAWPALRYANVARLCDELRPALFGGPLSVSVRQIETFAACPFQHFARHGLRLSDRESAGVGPIDLGNVYHRILEHLIGNAIRDRADVRHDPLSISREMIHQAAVRAARALRGELMLGSARNVYLLGRIERTIEQVIASQRHLMSRCAYRPLRAGLAFGPESALPPIAVSTPRGAQVDVSGKIDRIDALPESGDAIAIDYRLSASALSMQEIYHGLSLHLLAYLLALEGAGGELATQPLTPTAAFCLQLLRFYKTVKHPDDAPDPADPVTLLSPKPRGIFSSRALTDLDNACGEGWSDVVSAYLKKDGSFGYIDKSDAAAPEDFKALLRHARARIGQIADEILSGRIDVAPYRLSNQSPCARCEYRGVCRFETSVNGYRHLPSMNRAQVMEQIRQEGPR